MSEAKKAEKWTVGEEWKEVHPDVATVGPGTLELSNIGCALLEDFHEKLFEVFRQAVEERNWNGNDPERADETFPVPVKLLGQGVLFSTAVMGAAFLGKRIVIRCEGEEDGE